MRFDPPERKRLQILVGAGRSIDAPGCMAILHDHDFPLRVMLPASVFRAKAPIADRKALAMAHGLVSRLEILPAALGTAGWHTAA